MITCSHSLGFVNGFCISCGCRMSKKLRFDPFLRRFVDPVYGVVVDGRVRIREVDVNRF